MNIPTEHEEQQAFCEYLDVRRIKYFAIPNGFYTSEKNKSKKFGLISKFKKEGMKKGTPDMVVFLPHKILFVEMKRKKGGVLSADQKQWIEYINTLDYASAVVCRGKDEAIKEIAN